MVEQYEVNGSEDNIKEMVSCNPESPAGEEVGSQDNFEDVLNIESKDSRPASDVRKRRPTGYISTDNLEAHLSLKELDMRPKSSKCEDPVLIETKKGREESKYDRES
jgi:hypothetical protein